MGRVHRSPNAVASGDKAMTERQALAWRVEHMLLTLRADRLPECSFDGGKTWELDGVGIAETFSAAADLIEALHPAPPSDAARRDTFPAVAAAREEAKASLASLRETVRMRRWQRQCPKCIGAGYLSNPTRDCPECKGEKVVDAPPSDAAKEG